VGIAKVLVLTAQTKKIPARPKFSGRLKWIHDTYVTLHSWRDRATQEMDRNRPFSSAQAAL
jgi:hypothetical protein